MHQSRKLSTSFNFSALYSGFNFTLCSVAAGINSFWSLSKAWNASFSSFNHYTSCLISIIKIMPSNAWIFFKHHTVMACKARGTPLVLVLLILLFCLSSTKPNIHTSQAEHSDTLGERIQLGDRKHPLHSHVANIHFCHPNGQIFGNKSINWRSHVGKVWSRSKVTLKSDCQRPRPTTQKCLNLPQLLKVLSWWWCTISSLIYSIILIHEQLNCSINLASLLERSCRSISP